MKADGRAAGFGGSGEKRAETDVVKAFCEGGAGLVEGMGGAADEFARTDDFAGGCERAVVLAEVDAVGIEGGGEGGEIIEDEGNSGGAAKRQQAAGDTLDGGEVFAFGAELEEVGATG